MILEDTVSIAAPPEDVFRFFEEIDRHYLAWHPDHVLFRWEDGAGLRPGGVCYFEERIGGKLLKKRVVYTRVIVNELIEFAPTFWLMRLFLPRMSFRIDPDAAGCRVTAQIVLRMGPLAQRANRKDLAAVREHMRGESINLKRLVESGMARR